ncbi:S-layer homology domain-containing protein [Peptococcus simiae]|uniref:S-layer homology domain-containing protein n=1 Tax=Peptococcus simiae TaxID=1643805 RepID=A0ABW9GVK2_9FIRM
MLGADSPYLPGQNPTDADKAAAYGNVHVNFATEGLTNKGVMQPFQWKEIFGQDTNGKPSKAKIIFLQKDATTNAEINRFILEIDQAGKHTWTDQYGKPAKLPLYSTALEPYRYEVALDYQTSDKITFLTMEIGKSDSKATFKKDSDGKIVADIPLSITLGQVASTKFTSEWRTSVEEADRPPVEGLFDNDASKGDIADETGFFKFPKNDTGKTILRNDEKPIDEYNGFDEFYGNDLRTVPIVKVVEGFDLDTDSATYTLDEASKTITSLDGKKFKYDFAYDVINGGKLTMTEVIPVTFDANGGTFGPGAEQKVIQEVEYGQDASSVESPTPTEGKTFIGWGDRPDATNPVDQETAFKGITGAKTFYAIYTEDVIEQPGKDKPGNVPDGHVKITVQLTDKAEVKNDQGDLLTGEDYNKAITRIFWVNPDKQVTLPVAKPAGKTVPVSESNPTEYRWDFKNWTSDEKPSRAWTTDIDQGIKGQFEAAETLITANYDQVIIDNGDLVAGEITVPESFKTTDDAWMNNFVPKADDLKSLVQLKGTDGQVGQLPSDATFEFVLGKNSSGQPYGSLDEELYDKLKEKANPKDEPTRRETVQAKVTFKNGQVKEVAIPIQVVKNIYEAKTLTEKPYYVPDGYVKVTVNPTTKATDPQKTYFYVNPKAKVVIPGKDPTGKDDNVFLKWTQKADGSTNEPTDITIAGDVRNQFKVATTITAQYVSDVIPQKGDKKPGNVPDTFVKVTLVPTDKGTLEGPHVFWVNLDKAVTIPLGQLTPKKGWTLDKWTTGENRKVIDLTRAHTFTEAETVITARYSYDPQAIKDLEPQKVPVHTPEGKTPSPEDYKGKITPPDGKTIASVKIVENPDVTKPGDATAKVIITYTDGSSIGSQEDPVDIQVKVHEKVIPSPDGKKPEGALDNYVKVIFQAGTGGSLEGTLTYYVSPEVSVDMTEQAKTIKKTPAVGYLAQAGEAETWTNAENKTLQGTFTDKETIFIYNFVPNKDIIEKTPETPDQPAGYVTVTFRAGDKGQLVGPAGQETAVNERVFYVNPKAGIKLKVLEEGEQAGEKELAVPKPLAEENYGFDKWVEDLDLTNPITGNREYVAHFKLGQVTLTYTAGEGTGTPPAKVTAKHGATVQLANAPGLSKVNAVFAGWKLDGEDKVYPAGESIVLDRDRTATAQWTLDKDVIPQEGTNKPENVPNTFVKVTFVPTDKGNLEGPSVFWVNPDKAVTIPVQTPVGKQHFTFKEWKLGGETYQPRTPKTFKEDTTVTATYVEAADIIPYDPAEPMTKPDGYVRVSFAAQPGLSLENIHHYYVKKGAGITLGHADLVKPGVQASTGYIFTDWDTADTMLVDKDMTVTALAQALPDVQEKTEDQPDKPDPAYVTVTFTEDNSGNGQVTDKVYYVNPDKYVRLMPPTGADIQPSVGYVFGAWSQDARQATNYSKDTTITASFNKIGDVIPEKDVAQKPDGYVTVSFKIAGGGGEIKAGETMAYYVNPAAEVSLEAPAVSAATGHAFDTWTPNPAAARQYAEDTTIIGTFAGYPDIVPGKDEGGQPNVKPEAYVTVTFVTGSLGQLEGETVYYVNPDAGKVLGDLTKPTIKAKSGVKANGWNRKDSLAIVEDLIVVAEYDFIQEKPQPGGGSGGSSGWIIPPPKPDKPEVHPGPKPSESDLNKADHYQYLIGYPDGTFAPNRGMTRAEVATMFTRLLKDRPIKWKKYDAGFSDVKQGDWYANTVGYAVQKGIVTGYPDGSFKPNQPITRAEFSAIASRFAALTDEKEITFIDLGADHWGYRAIRLAASHGWISGYPDDTFRPDRAITRAEVTSITNRMLNRYGDLVWIDSHPDLIIHFSDVARTDWYYEPIMEATMGHDFTRDADGKHEHWTGINWKSFI